MNSKDFLNIKKEYILDLKELIEIESKDKKRKIKIPSGTESLDDLFEGGLCSGDIYLVFGASNTGKTQFCHQMCVQSVINKKIIYYFDTENTFRAERVSELAISRNINPELILKDIYVSKVMSSSMLLLSINDLKRKLNKNNGGVLIIDTINNYFRVDQGDTGSSFKKNKNNFLKVLEMLSKITAKFNLITIITAQISTNFLNDPLIREIPVGNQYLNHYISEYLYFRIEDGKTFSAHLANSQYLPEKKRYYRITSTGLEINNKY